MRKIIRETLSGMIMLYQNLLCQVADIERQIAKKGIAETSVKRNLAFREAEVLQAIMQEKDDKDKPKFSNETARSAELVIRLEDDDFFTDKINEGQKLRGDIIDLQYKLHIKKAEAQAYRFSLYEQLSEMKSDL